MIQYATHSSRALLIDFDGYSSQTPRHRVRPAAHRRRLERHHHHRAVAEQPAQGDRRVRREQHRRARAQRRHRPGKEHGEPYLSVIDDGDGIPRDDERHARTSATSPRTSATRSSAASRREGRPGIQGEFGIGLLRFWTVGEELTLTSRGRGRRGSTRCRCARAIPGYTVDPRHALFARAGTELLIQPLLPGIRQLSGEKIQWYLASELRDRIRQSGRQDQGHRPPGAQGVQGRAAAVHRPAAARAARRGHRARRGLPRAVPRRASRDNQVGLYRAGTRVLADLAELDAFQRTALDHGLPAGNRRRAVSEPHARHAHRRHPRRGFRRLLEALAPARGAADRAHRRAAARGGGAREPRDAARDPARVPGSAARAARRGVRLVRRSRQGRCTARPGEGPTASRSRSRTEPKRRTSPRRRSFFDYAGPLFSVRVSPASCVVPVDGATRTLRAIARDRSRRSVEEGVAFRWEVLEGGGQLDNADGEIVTFHAPAEPGLMRVRVTATQGDGVVRGRRHDHGHAIADRRAGARCAAGRAPRLHLRARSRRALALALRRRPQRHRHQQRPPRLRLRRAQHAPSSCATSPACSRRSWCCGTFPASRPASCSSAWSSCRCIPRSI